MESQKFNQENEEKKAAINYKFNISKDFNILSYQESIKLDKLILTFSIGLLGFITQLVLHNNIFIKLHKANLLVFVVLIGLIFIDIIIFLLVIYKKIKTLKTNIDILGNDAKRSIGCINNDSKKIALKLDIESEECFYSGVILLTIVTIIMFILKIYIGD